MQVPVGALAHQGTVVDHEVVEVATQVDVRFAWRPQLHNGRVVVQNVHPIHGPRRWVQDDGGLGPTWDSSASAPHREAAWRRASERDFMGSRCILTHIKIRQSSTTEHNQFVGEQPRRLCRGVVPRRANPGVHHGQPDKPSLLAPSVQDKGHHGLAAVGRQGVVGFGPPNRSKLTPSWDTSQRTSSGRKIHASW